MKDQDKNTNIHNFTEDKTKKEKKKAKKEKEVYNVKNLNLNLDEETIENKKGLWATLGGMAHTMIENIIKAAKFVWEHTVKGLKALGRGVLWCLKGISWLAAQSVKVANSILGFAHQCGVWTAEGFLKLAGTSKEEVPVAQEA